MTATDMLKQFRALGGTADNISIRPSTHGQGVFAINPGLPVCLVIPAQLLIPPQSLHVTPEGHVKVKPSTGLSAEVLSFHDNYQRAFGWGAGGWEYVHQHRQQLCALPDAVKTFLLILGCPDDLSLPHTPQEAFKRHCISRQINVNGYSRLMPVMELINHADEGAPYVIKQDGVSLSGTFEDEVLARYHQRMDAFHFFFNYHFATPSRSTLSCDVLIDVPGFKALRIARLDGLSEVRRGLRLPQVSTNKDEIQLSFVEIANLDKPALPRQVFGEVLMVQGLPISTADQLFDGLLEHNRQVLHDFLAACAPATGQHIESLKRIAAYQLANLNQV